MALLPSRRCETGMADRGQQSVDQNLSGSQSLYRSKGRIFQFHPHFEVVRGHRSRHYRCCHSKATIVAVMASGISHQNFFNLITDNVDDAVRSIR